MDADDGNETGPTVETPYETEDDSAGIQSFARENGTGYFNETPAPVPYTYVPPPVGPGKSLSATADNTATGSYEYVRQWGTYGTGNDQFRYPAGLMVDKTGNVYVADHYNSRVQKFDSNGTYLGQFGSGIYGSGAGQMQNPWGVAEDLSGNIYITDAGTNCRVQKYDAYGTFILQWGTLGTGNGQFYYPTGVATDSSGNVYVASFYNQQIQKFTSTGTLLSYWGSLGTGPGQFNKLAGMAIDASDNVYIVDYGNNRIQKFTSDGTYITEWGSYGTGDGQFNNVRGIGVDPSGNVYVADADNHRIQKFTSNGTFITKWGTYGSGDGEMSRPHGVGVDVNGNVYVTDFDNHRIQAFQQLDPLAADFTGYPTNGTAPLTVYFNDTSTGQPTSWTWSFGDGQFSTNRNCSHTYTSWGNYTVNLTIVNSGGSDTITKVEFVIVFRQGPSADFTASSTSGAAPLRVEFTDISTGQPPPAVVLWNFGDGETSITEDPFHLYTKPGTYTVNLTVKNKKGFDTETKVGYVTVNGGSVNYYVFADGVALYHYFENAPDLPDADKSAQLFNEHLTTGVDQCHEDNSGTTYCWYERDNPVDDNTGSRFWSSTESADSIGANSAEFAFHAGHGWNDGILFGTANNYNHVFRSNLSFSRAKWVALDSCLVLNNLSWTKWKSVFNGAHIVMGFDSVGLIDQDLGPQFVERMKGGTYGGENYRVYRIREAWESTLKDVTIDHTLKGAYMWAEPCKEDYLPGYGSFCTAPIKENLNYNIYWTTFDLI